MAGYAVDDAVSGDLARMFFAPRACVDGVARVGDLHSRKERFPIESLPKLGERMKKLPKGWQYIAPTL